MRPRKQRLLSLGPLHRKRCTSFPSDVLTGGHVAQPHVYKVHVDYITFVTGDGLAHMAAIASSKDTPSRVVAFKTGRGSQLCGSLIVVFCR